MKRKHLFTYFGLAIMIAASMFIYSCQKEQTGIEETKNQPEQSFEDAQLEKRIIAFRDKIDLIRENPSLKSGSDPMEIDSAVWYIESTSNLTYGSASYETEEFIIDSAFIEVPVTNGQILWADVQAAYDQVIDSLSEHNANITATEKQLIVADISLKESNENTATFEVTSGFGTDGTDGLGSGNLYPWYWGWEMGRCDGSGLGVGFDAADKIAQLANITIPTQAPSGYYTDNEIKQVTPYDYFDDDGNTMLFSDFQEYELIHACLSTIDISTYKSNLIYIMSQEEPPGKSVINYVLYDATAYSSCGPDNHDCWYMEHWAEIEYGIWHASSEPPSPL